ncbi:MAG TPA: hypothetical protein PLT65_03870 [Bacilli bacterium]|nr:hypothetical protein [Bacilli bacterium]
MLYKKLEFNTIKETKKELYMMNRKKIINVAKDTYQKREERKQKKLNSGENNGVNKNDINCLITIN